MMHYGDSFGDERSQTIFPISTTLVDGHYSWKKNLYSQLLCDRNVGFVAAHDSSSIARINLHGELVAPVGGTQRFTCMDESMLSSLQSNQWRREHGHVEMIPVAVVHQSYS
jgi:hypothetical protein